MSAGRGWQRGMFRHLGSGRQRSPHPLAIVALIALLPSCDRLMGRGEEDSTGRPGAAEPTRSPKPSSSNHSSGSVAEGSAPGNYAVGDHLLVQWQGQWYAASVLQTDGDRCKIHYTGWGAEWDEWVGPDRMRATKAGVAATANPPPARTAPVATTTATCFDDCATRSPPTGQQCCAPQMCQGDAGCTGGKVCCLAPGGHVAQCRSACSGGWTRFGAAGSTTGSSPMERVR